MKDATIGYHVQGGYIRCSRCQWNCNGDPGRPILGHLVVDGGTCRLDNSTTDRCDTCGRRLAPTFRDWAGQFRNGDPPHAEIAAVRAFLEGLDADK